MVLEVLVHGYLASSESIGGTKLLTSQWPVNKEREEGAMVLCSGSIFFFHKAPPPNISPPPQ
jgi:hypothetical protein